MKSDFKQNCSINRSFRSSVIGTFQTIDHILHNSLKNTRSSINAIVNVVFLVTAASRAAMYVFGDAIDLTHADKAHRQDINRISY
jgi:hypothetical protein